MSVRWPLVVIVMFSFTGITAVANTEVYQAVSADVFERDFFKWKSSNQGRKASLELMKQRCSEVIDEQSNLHCSLFVLSKMFEQKAANQIPDYYRLIKENHFELIEKEPALYDLLYMFGVGSLSVLKETPDFSIKRSGVNKLLSITPYSSDFYVSELVLPYIVVSGEGGNSAKFNLDTGATMTGVNYETAKKLGVKILDDSQYVYGTSYGISISAKLGVAPLFDIGGVEFRNTLVFIDTQENVLGLDLISKLGKITITKNAVEIGAQFPSQCDSLVIYHQAESNINQSLNFLVSLDDKPAMAIIDTGNNEFVISASPGNRSNELLSSGDNEVQRDSVTGFEYKTFSGVLALAKSSMRIRYKYYPEYSIPPSLLFNEEVPSLLFGWQMFDEFKLYLDVESGQSCFNKI